MSEEVLPGLNSDEVRSIELYGFKMLKLRSPIVQSVVVNLPTELKIERFQVGGESADRLIGLRVEFLAMASWKQEKG